MTSSRQLHRLATNPRDYIRFVTTGRLPRVVRPESPLIDLLEKIGPRDRCRIVGVTIGPSLGYSGSRVFDTAEQALNWVRPRQEMLEGDPWPAESWRDKRFAGPLALATLLASASSYPQDLSARHPRL